MSDLSVHPAAAISDDLFLAEHAGAIRALGKRMIGDIVEIGRRLAECKARVGHGGWLPWLDQEFGWTDRTALRFVQCYQLAGKSDKLSDLSIDASALYLLAAPSTPDEARDAVLNCEKPLSREEIEKLVDDARLKATSETVDRERAKAEQREKEIRAEFDGKLLVDEDDLTERLKKAMKPLEKAIEKKDAEIQRFKDREEKRREREKEKREKERKAKGEPKPDQGPRIDAGLQLSAAGVCGALEQLLKQIEKISPDQLVQIERDTGVHTGQSVQQRLGDAFLQARQAHEWLGRFLALENNG